MKLPYSRAMVTGAAAFIGSNVSQALNASGVEVHAVTLDGNLPQFLANNPEVRVHTADITDQGSIERLVALIRPEVVFHLAAYGTLTRERNIQPMVAVNIAGMYHLLQACAREGVRSFIYAGSAKVYAPSRMSIRETQELMPWDEYAVTKAAGEHLGRLAAKQSAMGVTVLRLSPVYGPGEDASRFVPTAIRCALTGEPFQNFVGPLVRNFTFVQDVVGAFLAAARRSSGAFEVFNIGSEEAPSFDQVLAAVEAATGTQIVQINTRSLTAPDDSWVLDSSRAAELLGWKARVTLAEGMAQAVASYGQRRWSTETVSSVLSDQTKLR